MLKISQNTSARLHRLQSQEAGLRKEAELPPFIMKSHSRQLLQSTITLNSTHSQRRTQKLTRTSLRRSPASRTMAHGLLRSLQSIMSEMSQAILQLTQSRLIRQPRRSQRTETMTVLNSRTPQKTLPLSSHSTLQMRFRAFQRLTMLSL